MPPAKVSAPCISRPGPAQAIRAILLASANADIYETKDGLNVVLEMPGVDKNSVDVRVEDDVLKVDGKLDFSKYQGLQPLYTEYNVGHFSRSFRLSGKIDQSKIAAELKDGVLSLRLPLAEQAKPRAIQVN